MSKLWVFGDSFSDAPQTRIEYSWQNLLANALKLDTIENRASPGVSNDWIFYIVTKNISNITNDDYVIIQTTQKHRQWFFQDQPTIANYWIKDFEKFVTKEQNQAVDMYVEHLQSDRIDDVRWAQFSLAIERLTYLVDTNILILPGFNSVNGVTGTLVNVSETEFITADSPQRYYDSHNGKDPRHNHLSAENHQILADKIFKFFNEGNVIDLTTDFKKSFLE